MRNFNLLKALRARVAELEAREAGIRAREHRHDRIDERAGHAETGERGADAADEQRLGAERAGAADHRADDEGLCTRAGAGAD